MASELAAGLAPVLAVALLTGGCAAAQDHWPRERLDPHTAVHMNIMAEPWVYARDVREVAVNARDYLHVGVVETNRSGQRAYWLGIVAWSTVDRSALPVPVAPVVPGRVRLLWPDDSIDLEPQPAGRAAIGAGDPVFNGPQPDFQDAWYQLSVAQMTRLARQPPVSVSLRLDDELSVAYYGWRVEQDSLAEFLRATGFTPRRP